MNDVARPTADPRDRPAWERELLRAVRAVRFGSVEVVIHDGRVTQIERRERVRFDGAAGLPDDRRPGTQSAGASGPPQVRPGPRPGSQT